MTKKNKLGTQHDDTNLFGGKNPRGLYVPMSEDEQEVIHRLVASQDIQLIIHGWGFCDNPDFIVGDHRVGVKFKMNLHKPEKPQPLYYLDLELKTRTGISLCRQKLPTLIGDQPIPAQAGLSYEFQWDISIHHLDPRLVKMIKPGAIGLTSRRQDVDTGEMTREGNMDLNPNQRAALHQLEDGYETIRKMDQDQMTEVVKRSTHGDPA